MWGELADSGLYTSLKMKKLLSKSKPQFTRKIEYKWNWDDIEKILKQTNSEVDRYMANSPYMKEVESQMLKFEKNNPN